jgi:integrase
MPLTDTTIRNAKSASKAFILSDGGGLYVQITPSGGKLWRLKYRYAGKEKLLAFGKYPEVTLSDARTKREDARKKLANNFDPSEAKRIEKQRREILSSNSFEAVARDWFTRHLLTKATSHSDKVTRRLEREVFPYIGSRPIAELTAIDILEVSRRTESHGSLDTAHRVLQNIGQVIRYAIQTGRATTDPTPALRGALTAIKKSHFAAPAGDPAKVGELLRMLDSFSGSLIVGSAIKLLPMLFCRPGELRTMKWSDVNLDAAEWRYTASKTSTEHLVPLSKSAVSILKQLHPLTGRLPGGFVFSGSRSTMRPMSDAAINAAYRRLGIDTRKELTGHGWRAVARTMLHERLGFAPEVIEHQLAHAVKDANGTSYNRTKFIDERRRMMQSWSDYLGKLKVGADVIPLHGKVA